MNLSDFETLKTKLTSSPELNQLHQLIIARSNSFVTLPELTYQKVGGRLLSVSSEALNRIFHCAYAYRMTGESKYLEKAERELQAICQFPDWNPDHLLDAAEMSAAVAFGYDWLYPELKEETKALIISEINKKAFTPSFLKPGVFKRINNWNQVCNGGFTVAALAVFEEMMLRCKDVIERTLDSNPLALAAYGPDDAAFPHMQLIQCHALSSSAHIVTIPHFYPPTIPPCFRSVNARLKARNAPDG